MYHEAFEKDSDEQRWDSGCWIRYKMFERVVDRQPSAQPERCEDCRNFNKARLLIPQPERKEGKWIYLNGLDAFECSVCGRQMVRNIFDYCPWCGARMNGGDDGGET